MTHPVTVLTGFLGSGKTTLLNRLLLADHGHRLAVIVNELGAIGIDGRVVGGDAQFVELDNGCLCCALNADLEKLLRDLRARGGFDQLVLETTGIADPLPIGWTFSRPGLSDFYRLDAIVTVVDAVNVARVVTESAEARAQLERGDLLVLNKLDLVRDDGREAEGVVRQFNDAAPILRAVQGNVPWQLVLTSDAPSRWRGLPVVPGHTHDTEFESWAWTSKAVLSEARLEDLLYALPPTVYRSKGIVRTDEPWCWTLMNSVAGRFELRPWERRADVSEPTESVLVFIGKGLDRDALRLACDGLVVGDPR